jgi:hypothetical protein
MNTLTYAALAAFLVAGSIIGVKVMDKVTTDAVTIAVSAQESYIDASLRQRADFMCPGVPDTPLYAEIRTAYQCARYGH